MLLLRVHTTLHHTYRDPSPTNGPCGSVSDLTTRSPPDSAQTDILPRQKLHFISGTRQKNSANIYRTTMCVAGVDPHQEPEISTSPPPSTLRGILRSMDVASAYSSSDSLSPTTPLRTSSSQASLNSSTPRPLLKLYASNGTMLC